ncbi:MAG: hypothetical protein DSY80_08850 [Desulfocapsa sp.]|nr:MAG: hypothetical protein DSY80_08850 [Desulfocapsa sp.]
MTHKYIIKMDCWLYGKFYAAGEEVVLTDVQAKYERHKLKPVSLTEPTKLNIPAPRRNTFVAMRDRINARNEQSDRSEN